MDKNPKTTTKEIAETLEQINQNTEQGNKLVFDPNTSEFVVVREGENLPADATTINQIAKDGFAKS